MFKIKYDEENPLYEQFRNVKIIELKNKGIYKACKIKIQSFSPTTFGGRFFYNTKASLF